MKKIFTLIASLMMVLSMSAATKTIYCKMSQSWWKDSGASVGAYMWTDDGASLSWPGVKMTPVTGETDLWSVEVDTDKYKKIIFTRLNSAGTEFWGAQTNDLEVPKNDNNLYTITQSSVAWSNDGNKCAGNWSTYTPPTEIVIPDRYLTGTLAGGWNANDIKMTYDETNEIYTHTFTSVAADTEHKLKVTDGTWSNSWGGNNVSPAIDGVTADGDGNAVFTLSTAGDVTVTFDGTNIQLTTTGAFKVAPKFDYYIVGSFNSWNTADANYGMTKEGDVYKKEVTFAAATEFKVCNGSWAGAWGANNLGDNQYIELEGTDNLKMKVEKTFTIIFNPTENLITFDGLTVKTNIVTYDYYVIGTVNNWGLKDENYGMTDENADGVYEKEITLAANTKHELKINNGSWDDNTQIFGFDQLNVAYEGVSRGSGDGDNNVVIELTEDKTITVKFDKNAGKITLGGLTEKVVEYGVTFNVTVPEGTPACYICGAWDWNTFKPMTKVDDTHYTLEIAEATKDHGYKYTCGEGWEFVEKDAEGNDLAGDRTWSENDVVAAWAAPAEPVEMASVVLMGVDGDWATGVEMELNPNDANEYMLLCQSITADEPIKIKAVDTQSTVTWCAKLADTSLGTVEKDADGNENIVLEEGKYDFYYKVAENEVWIGTCTETPEVGGEMDLLVTDLVIMEDSDAQMALLMGTDSEVGIEFALMLTGYTGEYNKEYQLSADESVLSLSGEESLVSGSLTKISDPDLGDVYQGVVYATLMGMYWQFNLTMYYVEVPAIEINVNNATVVEELYDNYVGGTGSEWSLSGNWTYEGEPATVKVTIYDEVDKSVSQKEMQVDVETDYGFVQGNAMVIIDATTMTVQGELSNQMSGAKYKFNISGALPTCPTIRLNIADNKNVLAATNNKEVNVIVNRSFEANDGYYTLCLPFDMQASVVGKAYQISTITEHAAQGINVEFTEVTTMLAGQPYLIKPNNLDNFTVEAVTIKNTTTPVTVTGEGISITMQGMFNRDGKTNGLYWVGNGGYLYNDDVYTNGLCAYFNISTPSGVAPRMRVVTKEDAETGVEDIFSTDVPVKAIVNGQLIIIRDGVKYNVQGQKL